MPPFRGAAPKLLFLYSAKSVECSACSGKCTNLYFSRFERREARQMRSIFARANEEAFIHLLESILVHRISFVSTGSSVGIDIS